MKTKSKLTFAQLPREYVELCRLHLPRVIRDRVDYDNTMEIVETMVLHAERFTSDQKDYFELLSHLVADYDAAEVKWPKVKTSGVLEHLLAERAMTAADLSRVLGASRNLGGGSGAATYSGPVVRVSRGNTVSVVPVGAR